jgi:hypothetical protein
VTPEARTTDRTSWKVLCAGRVLGQEGIGTIVEAAAGRSNGAEGPSASGEYSFGA